MPGWLWNFIYKRLLRVAYLFRVTLEEADKDWGKGILKSQVIPCIVLTTPNIGILLFFKVQTASQFIFKYFKVDTIPFK